MNASPQGSLHVLLVDASTAEAEPVVRELRQWGYAVTCTRVATRAEMQRALAEESPDVILCEYVLPGFPGEEALRLARLVDADIPFIFVSAAAEQETAMLAMRAGAQDFITKDSLARLAPAIARELRESAMRREARRAEAVMRESEHKYRHLFESLGDAAFLYLEATGQVIDTNGEGETLVGGPRSEILGRKHEQFYVPPFVGLGARERLDFEAELVRRDGRRLPVQVSVSRVLLHDRAFGLALVRDITEQKRLEALLNGQLQILEQLSQGAPLADSLNELLRLAETHSPGLYASILFYDEETGQLRHGAAPSLPASYMAAIDGVKIGPAVGSCGTAVFRREEVIVEDVTRSPLWREFQGLALAHGLRACWSVPIFTTQRRVLGSLALYATEPALPQPIHRRLMAIVMHTAATAISRHRMETALRESEARLESAQRIAHVGYWDIELATARCHWSAETFRLAGLEPRPGSLTRDEAEATILAEDRPRVLQLLLAALQGGPRFQTEYRVVRPNGECRLLHSLGDIESDESGRPRRVYGTVQDITDYRKLEDQFRQAQKMEAVGQLAGGLAHDFNNLLTVVQMQCALLLEDAKGNAAVETGVQQIMDAATRGATLTHQLLTFSRRHLREQRQDIDVGQLLGSMTTLLRRILGEHIEFILKAPSGLPPVCADRGMLEQVVMNLTINARDAMSAGGSLTLEASGEEIAAPDAAAHPGARPGRFVCVRVSDTGSGIPPEVLPHIFEPFFTTKDVGKGTGLGLATVFGIVHHHEGWIDVESTPGRGTTFRVYLPAGVVASGRPEAPALAVRPEQGTETILLVEDEDGVRSLAASGLRREGYTVIEARSGAEALAQWQRHRGTIDLVLTDLVMPGGMSGQQLADALRAQQPDLKVIYSTGYSEELVTRALPVRAGWNYLPKPYTLDVLAATVRRRLDTSA